MDKSHDQNLLGCAHYVSKVENLNKAKSSKTLLSSVGQISHEKHGECHYKQTLALRGEYLVSYDHIIQEASSELAHQLRSDRIRSYQIISDQIKSAKFRSYHITSDQIRSDIIRSDQIRLDQIRSDQII